MTSPEFQLQEGPIKKRRASKYEDGPAIRDRAALEQNCRERLQTLNHLRLMDGEFQRLLDEITIPAVFIVVHPFLALTIDRTRLYCDDFTPIALRCPRRPEQRRIVDCLSSLDALNALQGHKKGLMQQLLPAAEES
ncbi:MAG: hypothetical protein KJZ87_03705 [Thermoguttaceae bacterium]|nr:hypothetical protein [Thermoguttaceae bacterium]